jgi:hypothetical protein
MNRIQFARRSLALFLSGSVALGACTMPPATVNRPVPEVTATSIAATAAPTDSVATTVPTLPPAGGEFPISDGHPHVPESQLVLQAAQAYLAAKKVDFVPAGLGVDGIDGEYARVSGVLNDTGETYLAYLQRNESGWEVIMDAKLEHFALRVGRLEAVGIPWSLLTDLVQPGPPIEQPGDIESIEYVVRQYVAEYGGINGPFTVAIDGIELDYARATVVPEAATEPGLVFLQRVADAWIVVVAGSPLRFAFDQRELIERGFPESLYADLVEAPAHDEEAIRLAVDQHIAATGGVPGSFFVQVDRIEQGYARVSLQGDATDHRDYMFLQYSNGNWLVVFNGLQQPLSEDLLELIELNIPQRVWIDLQSPESPFGRMTEDEAVRYVALKHIAAIGGIGSRFSSQVDAIDQDYARVTLLPDASHRTVYIFLQRIDEHWEVLLDSHTQPLSMDVQELYDLGIPAPMFDDLPHA